MAAGIMILPAAGEENSPPVARDPHSASAAAESHWYSSPAFVSCSVSTGAHLLVLLLFGLVWSLTLREQDRSGVDSRFLESRISRPETILMEETIVRRSDPPAVELISGGASRVVSVRPAPPLDIAPRARTFLTTAAIQSNWLSTNVTETIDLVGSALAGVASDGDGNGTGSGAGDGTGGLFGLRPVGKRFVYVLDCSKSMNHPHDSEAKTRFKRMQIELVNSVKSMSADQEFYFIFFNDYVIRMPSRGLTPATHDLKVKYLTWMGRLQADGNTEPKGALHLALSLQPDVVYFLTDGTFDYRVEQELLEFPRTRAAVHTFAFREHFTEEMREVYALFNTNDGARARKLVSLKEFRKTRAVWRSHQLLKKLAENHKGTFQIIP
ncbi:MAG: hypothetical protein VB858_15585 [Planctomycetaceae bacterium]